jgi:hypothetical protein
VPSAAYHMARAAPGQCSRVRDRTSARLVNGATAGASGSRGGFGGQRRRAGAAAARADSADDQFVAGAERSRERRSRKALRKWTAFLCTIP